MTTEEDDVLFKTIKKYVSVALITAATLTALGMWGCPQLNVYQATMSGRAKLREAESSRQIAIVEAEAKKESASKLAEAEVARAEGVARANKIIGESLHGNEGYLRYLWIQTLGEGKNEVIYVPTEANLPILEAQRLAPKPVSTPVTPKTSEPSND
jgi:hypothetical protein